MKRVLRRVVRYATAWAFELATVTQADAASPGVIRDDRGHEHHFAQAPRRIVSLLPSLTESVCVLGACAHVVGTDRHSNWPASVQALPKLGGLDDAQLERIVALRPDLVLTGASSRVIDRLDALGIPVFVVEAKTLADVQRVLVTVARVLDRPDAGVQVWADIEADLTEAAAHMPANFRGQRVYFEVSSSPHAAGAASFIGETLALLGLANIVPPELGPFPQLNPEYIVRARPDLIIAAQRTVAELSTRPGWARIPAVQTGHICGFATAQYDVLVRPGPRLGEAADLLVDCLSALSRRAVR